MSRGQRKTTVIAEVIPTIHSDEISIIKTANCPSSSGRTELTYQLGHSSQHALYVRIHGNSNNGYFNEEWVSIERILEKLSKQLLPFSSFPLRSLFEGKSINTPHFLVAILLAEGLLVRDSKNSRYFNLGDVDGFMARSKALMETGEITEAMTIKPERSVKPVSKQKAMAIAADKGCSGDGKETAPIAIELTDSDESLLETLLQAG
jgi:hypothetical protein